MREQLSYGGEQSREKLVGEKSRLDNREAEGGEARKEKSDLLGGDRRNGEGAAGTAAAWGEACRARAGSRHSVEARKAAPAAWSGERPAARRGGIAMEPPASESDSEESER